MHNIDAAGNDSGTFRDPTPPDVQGTVVDAKWLNAVQGELVNVIEGAGITLDDEDSGQLLAAVGILAAPKSIPLKNWITSEDEYTVERNEGLRYEYLFGTTASFVMYTEESIPIEGYDLRLVLPCRMSTADASKAVVFRLAYKWVSSGDSAVAYTTWAEFAALYDGVVTLTHSTPDTTGEFIVDTDDFKLPAGYSRGDRLLLALVRPGGEATDTHGGDLLISDSIELKPVA